MIETLKRILIIAAVLAAAGLAVSCSRSTSESADGGRDSSLPDASRADSGGDADSDEGPRCCAYLEWVVQGGGAGDDQGKGIDITETGSLISTGTIGSGAYIGGTEMENGGVFLAQYKSNGDPEWGRMAVEPSTGTDTFYGIDVKRTGDGSNVIVGYFVGTGTFGKYEDTETTITSVGWQDLFIAKYSSKGDFEWVRHVGGFSFPSTEMIFEGGSLVLSDDGSIVVSGSFTDGATFGLGEPNETTLRSYGLGDAFVAKYASDGSLIWARSPADSVHTISKGVKVSQSGAIFLVGQYLKTATFGKDEDTETPLTDESDGGQLFLAEYGSDGGLVWAKGTHGDGAVSPYSVETLADGSSIAVGGFDHTAIFGRGEKNETTLVSIYDNMISQPDYSQDIFIAKYQSDGTLAWVKTAGGVHTDFAEHVTATSDDSLFISGLVVWDSTFGQGEPNETTLEGYGLFIAQYSMDGTLSWAKLVSDTYGCNDMVISPEGSIFVIGDFLHACFGLGGDPNEDCLQSQNAEEGDSDIFIAKFSPK